MPGPGPGPGLGGFVVGHVAAHENVLIVLLGPNGRPDQRDDTPILLAEAGGNVLRELAVPRRPHFGAHRFDVGRKHEILGVASNDLLGRVAQDFQGAETYLQQFPTVCGTGL